MIISHHFSAILTVSPAILDWKEADFLTLLNKAAMIAELTPVGELAYAFKPQGISAVLLLEESHVALHFWPEEGQLTIDIHVCNYQQNNKEKAKVLAELLTLEISGEINSQVWNYLCITG